MFIYILSDCNTIIGVFSNLNETEKQYKKIYKNNNQLFTVKLKRFTLDNDCEKSIDLTYMLHNWSNDNDSDNDDNNSNLSLNNNIKNIKYDLQHANYMLKRQEFECEYCYGSHCYDGCVNDNFM